MFSPLGERGSLRKDHFYQIKKRGNGKRREAGRTERSSVGGETFFFEAGKNCGRQKLGPNQGTPINPWWIHPQKEVEYK